MRPLNRLQGLQSFGLGIAAVVFIVASPSARAEIPGASDPKAFTSRDAREQEYEFNRRTLVEEYEKVGHRDPRWDKQAEQLLELEAIYFTQGGLSVKQPFAKRATVAELYAAADAATAAGCDDPLVLDAFCVACHDRQAFDEWKHWSTTAVNGMLASRYPAWRKANAARRSLGLLDRQKDAMRWTKNRGCGLRSGC